MLLFYNLGGTRPSCYVIMLQSSRYKAIMLCYCVIILSRYQVILLCYNVIILSRYQVIKLYYRIIILYRGITYIKLYNHVITLSRYQIIMFCYQVIILSKSIRLLRPVIMLCYRFMLSYSIIMLKSYQDISSQIHSRS